MLLNIKHSHLLLLFVLLFAVQTAFAAPEFEVEGVKGNIKSNIQAHVDFANEKCELPAWRQRGLLRSTEQNTRNALKALGYYQPQVHTQFDKTDKCWKITSTVTLDDPVLIEAVDIQIIGPAAKDQAFNKARQHEALVIGERLAHSQYEKTKSDLVQLAADRGYLLSELTEHRLEIDVPERKAYIRLTLESGPRYHFRHIQFDQDTLNQALAERFLTFSPGMDYESRHLINYQQALSGSGYYTNIRVDTKPDHEEQAVDVISSADPRPRHGYLAGIGYSTDVGPRLRLGYENRRANRRGHRYNSELELSEIRSEISFNYEIPVGDPKRQRVNLGTSYLKEKTNTSESERYRAGIAYIKELPSGWVATPFLDFEREYFTVAKQKDRTDLVMPGFDFSRSRGNHPIYPTRGWRLNSRIRVADENLASSVSFVQLTGYGKVIQPLLKKGRIMARLDIGTTLADDVIVLPTSVRFFAGGDHSVRGYGYQRLGPKNDDGDVIGGRHKLTGGIEYDYLFAPSWAWAVFVDAGNAYDTLDDFEALYGYGAGVRWRSPIGPIRLDIARPSDKREAFRIHVSMGPDL